MIRYVKRYLTWSPATRLVNVYLSVKSEPTEVKVEAYDQISQETVEQYKTKSAQRYFFQRDEKGEAIELELKGSIKDSFGSNDCLEEEGAHLEPIEIWLSQVVDKAVFTAQDVKTDVDNAASAELKQHFDVNGEVFWRIFEIRRQQQNDEKHAQYQANEREMVGNVVWGDMLWQLGDSLALGIDKVQGSFYTQPCPGMEEFVFWTGAATIPACALVWPLLLAVIVTAKYYRDAIARIVEDTGLPPTTEEIAQIRMDTFILSVKVAGAIFGWEMGQYVGTWMVNYVIPAAIGANSLANPLGHLIIAGMIGAALGLTLALMNLIYKGLTGPTGSFGATLIESAKLFGLGLVAGALWYGIGAIFPPANLWQAIFFPFVRAISTYLAIKCIYFDFGKLIGSHDQPYTFESEKVEMEGKEYSYMTSQAMGTSSCFRCCYRFFSLPEEVILIRGPNDHPDYLPEVVEVDVDVAVQDPTTQNSTTQNPKIFAPL